MRWDAFIRRGFVLNRSNYNLLYGRLFWVYVASVLILYLYMKYHCITEGIHTLYKSDPPPPTHKHMVIFKTLLEFLDISKTSSVHYYHRYFYTTSIMYSSFCALSPVKRLRNINRLKYHKHCTIIYCISIIYNQVSAKPSFINPKFKPE